MIFSRSKKELEHIAEEIRLYIPTFFVLEERINDQLITLENL